MGIASPPFLHINCENLRIPNIVLQEKWQEEEIKLSNSIEIGGEIYFWENAMTSLEGLSPSAYFRRAKKENIRPEFRLLVKKRIKPWQWLTHF